MKLLLVSIAAALAVAPAANAASFSTKTLSDIHVGTSKTELVAQRQHSEDVIEFFQRHHWMTAPRHKTCAAVPWSQTCRRARSALRAHRWLHGLAVKRWRTLYAPKPVSVPGVGCWSCWENVASCESGGNWSDDTGNGFYGGLQFTIRTWIGAGGLRYADRADHATKAEQIAIASTLGLGNWPICGALY